MARKTPCRPPSGGPANLTIEMPRKTAKKEEAAAKQKASADAVKKAQDDRINAIKQYQQISIEANNKGIPHWASRTKFSRAIAQHELACRI